MADILIQFHAAPEELLIFVKQIVKDYGLHVVAMKFFPFGAIEVNSSGLDGIFAESSPYDQLGLIVSKPILSMRGTMDFLDKNPNALCISIERKGEKGMRQSSLSARTDDAAILSVWKKVAKLLKDMTQTGVIVINPDTGASVLDRTFRYSAGAKSLASSGLPMLPIAGGNVIEFSDSPTLIPQMHHAKTK